TAPLAPPAPAGRPRDRRAAVALVAGVAALALAAAGLTYALMNRDNGGVGKAGTSSGPADGGVGGGSPSSGRESTGTATAPTGVSASATGGGRTTSPPAQYVRVTVTGTHTDYSGACPPPEAQAPTFTATFTVGSVPVDVSYRWVTVTGQLSDQGWKTLSFAAGEGKTKQTRVVVTAYETGAALHDGIGVEVRDPVHITSDSVPFTVTCETETPTGGASPSSS
ncbi:serine/threonine protein kinase, partial [Streptomyces caeni]